MSLRLIENLRYMPALGFVLLAAGWSTMVLVGHYPATEWAWRLTLAASWLMRDSFYLGEYIFPVAAPGQILLCLFFAGLSVVAIRNRWLAVRFFTSHAVAITFGFHLIVISRDTASSAFWTITDFSIALRPDAAIGSLAIFLMIAAGCVVDHIDFTRRIRGIPA